MRNMITDFTLICVKQLRTVSLQYFVTCQAEGQNTRMHTLKNRVTSPHLLSVVGLLKTVIVLLIK